MEPRLTDRQREVLDFIQSVHRGAWRPADRARDRRALPRHAPSCLRPPPGARAEGLPPAARTAGRTSRALTLAVPPSKPDEVPILGRIAAGAPLLAEENREGTLPLDPACVGGRGDDVFGLRVRGESMINAHIVEGDLVLVRRQDHAQPGDIVVALVDGEATVKRFARDANAVLLRPEHPTMGPIVIREGEKDLRILGKVVGLVRGI